MLPSLKEYEDFILAKEKSLNKKLIVNIKNNLLIKWKVVLIYMGLFEESLGSVVATGDYFLVCPSHIQQ